MFFIYILRSDNLCSFQNAENTVKYFKNSCLQLCESPKVENIFNNSTNLVTKVIVIVFIYI